MYRNEKIHTSKIVTIGLLVMTLLLVFALLFSYSVDAITSMDSRYKVQITEGVNLKIDVKPSERNERLVPYNYAVNSDETEELEAELTVSLDGIRLAENVEPYAVELGVENVRLDGQTDVNELISYNYRLNGVLVEEDVLEFEVGNEAVNIQILFYLEEPSGKEVYDAIAGKTITYGIVLRPTQINI